MHRDLAELGWTEEHWNRIDGAVTEEAQKARVAAQFLTMVGPVDSASVAVPAYTLGTSLNPLSAFGRGAAQVLEVNSDPTLFLTKIAVNVYVRAREAVDPELNAVLTMFRRAANYIGRVEDALIFNGRPGPNALPPYGLGGIPSVYNVTGDGAPEGLIPFVGPAGGRTFISVAATPTAANAMPGDQVVTAIVQSINQLEGAGHLPPFGCVLSPQLFEDVCTPNTSLVTPRERILPALQGPLLRSSAVRSRYGVVVALSASPVELVVASDIHVQYLQTTEEPRLVFQVSERVALRIKEPQSIAVLQ